MAALRIFISNAAEDDQLCLLLAAMLKGRGCSVWRHEKRSKSAAYRAGTLSELNSAEIVIVLWSAASIRSPWVIDEADVGMKKGTAIAVRVAGAEAPLGFAGAIMVRARMSSAKLSEKFEVEIWEAIVEAAETARSPARRLWFDRSIGAVLGNAVVDLALFGSLAIVGGLARWPDFFFSPRGALWTVLLAIMAFGCGYFGDWLSQKLGARARSYRRRLLWRWCAESVGAGMGAFVFDLALDQIARGGREAPFDELAIFLVGGALVSALLLTLKFVPLLVSPRLQRWLLGRPLS